jgi:UDP-N-acetylmuramyl pentapeptide synthase
MLELGEAAADLHREVGGVAAGIDRIAPIAAAVLVGAFAGHYHEGLRAGGWGGEALILPALDAAGVAEAVAFLRTGDRVLLKGSRGSAMERLLAGFATAEVGSCGPSA